MIWNGDYNYLFATLAAMVFTLNSITIPVSFSIIADKYKEYLDKNVANYFVNRQEFKENLIISFLCVVFFLLPLFINVRLEGLDGDRTLKNDSLNLRGGYLISVIVLAIWFFITFYQFSKMIYHFVTNTEEIVFEQIKSDIDAYLSK